MLWRRSCRALCCFFTNAKIVIMLNTEMQHRTSKPEIAKCSLREPRTAALSFYMWGNWALCREMGKSHLINKWKSKIWAPWGHLNHVQTCSSCCVSITAHFSELKSNSCTYEQLFAVLFMAVWGKFIPGFCGNREWDKDNKLICFDIFFKCL